MTEAEIALRIVIVTSGLAIHDAISNAVGDAYRAFTAESCWHVTVIAGFNFQDCVPVTIVCSASELLMDSDFRSADIIIYHFGIYYALFDGILAGNGRAAQIVRFHNITPLRLAGPGQLDVLRRSFAQLYNLKFADHVWADSKFNVQTLVDLGLGSCPTSVLPLAVDEPELRLLSAKVGRPIRLLYVSRVVPSKGLWEAIESLESVLGEFPDVVLTVVGNLAYSDREYLQRCIVRINELGVADNIVFAMDASADELAHAYSEAHVLLLPTRHEGFCVPVVEALRAGAIPVGYDAGNMQNIVRGYGRLAREDNLQELKAALLEVLRGLRQAKSGSPEEALLPLDGGPTSVSEFDANAKSYVRQFEFERIASSYRSSIRLLLATCGLGRLGQAD